MATSTGTAAQGISAAIVYTAIEKITDMIGTAEEAMQRAVDTEINAALRSVPKRPGVADVLYAPVLDTVNTALEGTDLSGAGLDLQPLPLFLDGVVGSFFDDYLGKLDELFPGLGAAGADAEAFAIGALNGAVGMSYNEAVDSTPAHTAFLMAQKEVQAKEREVLAMAAAGGHRFAHGHAMEAIARMRGDSVASATEALLQSHARRLQQERDEKMRMARSMLDTSMDRIKRLNQQVAEALKLQLRARGMWINDQNAVVDSANNVYALREQFKGHVMELLRRTATRRVGLKMDEAQTRDRDDFLGKLKMANANEVVDLFGNMVTTLMNQVNARGGYQGSERDVTDWDSLLA